MFSRIKKSALVVLLLILLPWCASSDGQDYRNTLYWNPDVSFIKPAVFWSSDNKMKYLISIQGITGEGRPFSLSKIFEVK